MAKKKMVLPYYDGRHKPTQSSTECIRHQHLIDLNCLIYLNRILDLTATGTHPTSFTLGWTSLGLRYVILYVSSFITMKRRVGTSLGRMDATHARAAPQVTVMLREV